MKKPHLFFLIFALFFLLISVSYYYFFVKVYISFSSEIKSIKLSINNTREFNSLINELKSSKQKTPRNIVINLSAGPKKSEKVTFSENGNQTEYLSSDIEEKYGTFILHLFVKDIETLPVETKNKFVNYQLVSTICSAKQKLQNIEHQEKENCKKKYIPEINPNLTTKNFVTVTSIQ